MLSFGNLVTDGSEGGKLQTLARLGLEFRLKLGVHHRNVHIVVFQLVLDVERCVVPGVEFVRVQGAGSAQSVGIGVDVKIPLHCSFNGIHL